MIFIYPVGKARQWLLCVTISVLSVLQELRLAVV